MSTTEDKIKVMQAYDCGKIIEYNSSACNDWTTTSKPRWNWACYEYRVKPEPREFWVNVYPHNCMPGIHRTKEEAVRRCESQGKTILVREVMDE